MQLTKAQMLMIKEAVEALDRGQRRLTFLLNVHGPQIAREVRRRQRAANRRPWTVTNFALQ